MVYAQTRICPREWDTQTPLVFLHTSKCPNLGQTTKPYDNQQKRELAKLGILLSLLTTASNWKKVKRKINIWTLQGNWNTVEHKSDCHTNCDWCSWYSHQSIIKRTEGLGNIRMRLSKLQHRWDRPEYWEESWRLEETCHSNSSERRSAYAGVKHS